MIDPDVAIAQLADSDEDVRLSAARALARSARPGDRDALRRAAESEENPWVRRWLLRAEAVAARDTAAAQVQAPDVSDAERAEEMLAVATGQVTRLLLHEFNPVIGDLRRYVERECGDDYTATRAWQTVERLDRLTEAIAELNRAAAHAVPAEFDVALLLTDVAEHCADRTGIAAELSGPTPCLILGDKKLLEIAVDQGLRNAAEASAAANASALSLTWSTEHGRLMVTVGDRGPGLPGGFDKAFKTIQTSKDKRIHFGIGLYTANHAAKSMKGTLSVAPRLEGGTAFVLSIPLANNDIPLANDDANPAR